MNRFKRVYYVILIIILAGFWTKYFFRVYYFPRNPTSIEITREKLNYEESKSTVFRYHQDDYVGGCYDQCFGSVDEQCVSMSQTKEVCDVKCYGYLYNNCSDNEILGTLANIFLR